MEYQTRKEIMDGKRIVTLTPPLNGKIFTSINYKIYSTVYTEHF